MTNMEKELTDKIKDLEKRVVKLEQQNVNFGKGK